jgi:hypothetical protein
MGCDDAIHGWMTRRMDGWKKLHEKRPRRPLLYVIYIVAEMFETSKRYLVSKTNNFVKENRELFWNIQEKKRMSK